MHIGLFDSGVGGLTVLSALKKHFPHADYSYLGDTARLPYGNKAPETLLRYTHENIEFLDSLDVDVIVIACHSASSVALEITESAKGTPVHNVIQPSCAEALARSEHGPIGVMATKATTSSQVYPNHIQKINAKAKVFSQACPLLVPLVEEGLIDDEITEQILQRYLGPLLAENVSTLILGCTHYPILEQAIGKVCGSSVALINPADSVARELAQLNNPSYSGGSLTIFLTDHAPHFVTHAQTLLATSEKLEIRHP